MRTINHNDANALLPWLVNDTLDEAEQLAVQEHVRECDACKEDAQLLSRMRDAVTRENTVPFKPQANLGDLLDRVDSARTPSPHAQWFRDWRFAASLAALAISVGIVIGPVRDTLNTKQVVLFETATSDEHPARVTFLLSVTFQPGVNDNAIEQVVSAFNAADIPVGAPSSVRRLAIELPLNSLAALDEMTSRLEALPDVQHVRIEGMEVADQQTE